MTRQSGYYWVRKKSLAVDEDVKRRVEQEWQVAYWHSKAWWTTACEYPLFDRDLVEIDEDQIKLKGA